VSQIEQEQRGRSGWLLLLVPLIATLGAGGYFGRSYFDVTSTSSELAVAGSDQLPASTPAVTGTAGQPQATPAPTPSPSPSASSPRVVPVKGVDLGRISGRYVLKGPAKAPSGSVVMFAVTGPKRAAHTDTSAPFSYSFDSSKIPNGKYTVKVTVIRPDLPTLVQNRQMQVANGPRKKAPSVPATPSKPGTSGLSAQAAEVLKLTNAERAKAGCKALSADSRLTAAAQAHSADMAKNNYFSHDSQNGTSPFDRMKKQGYTFRAAAENIAYGQPTAASVLDAWMKSPGHKTNILNCTYTQIGIGYALRGETPYWTQNFGTPL
jgi:uncharacterized protein YkwD